MTDASKYKHIWNDIVGWYYEPQLGIEGCEKMAWWDHEELKSPENRSDRYKISFPNLYTEEEVRLAYQRLQNEHEETKRVVEKYTSNDAIGWVKTPNSYEAGDSIIEVKDSPTKAANDWNCKFDEPKYLAELEAYLKSTYEQHYAKGNVQTFELIVSSGQAEGFTMGSVMKYASRYGKKNGYNRKDLLKIIHYALLQLYVHDKEGRN